MYRLESETGQDALFTQEGQETAACHLCGCEETREVEGEGFECAECSAPIYNPTEEGDDDHRDAFAEYMEELELEMGDGDE
jgi:hypothetical protein